MTEVDNAQREYLKESWYSDNWLPRYRQTIEQAKQQLSEGQVDALLPRLWSERNNSVSSAGQGTMSRVDFDRNVAFLRQLTLEIAADPSPAEFDRAASALKQRVAEGQLKWFPRLILARVFAALAPDRYHTTVDERKHDRVLEWFAANSPFRAPDGNWATRSLALTQFLDTLQPRFVDSLTRNMFPWFVYERINRLDNEASPAAAVERAESMREVPVHHDRARNIIYYGPPGTGKTRKVLELLADSRYAERNDHAAPDELRRGVVSSATWMQIATATLLDGKPRSVAEMLSDPVAKLFVELVSRTKTPANTIWNTLQTHTVDSSATVKYASRIAPQIFDKDSESRWRIVVSNWRDLDPDLAAAVDELRNPRGGRVRSEPRVEFVTFHPNYSYEEFVEGLRPVAATAGEEGQVGFAIKDGVFKRQCAAAHLDPANRYALVIDEINRANIAKVFGELITLIEDDKRVVPGAQPGTGGGIWVTLPGSGQKFGVPSNLDVYGTMNTADRSIALLDVALRRRFEFEPIYPDPGVLRPTGDGIDLPRLLETLNLRLEYFLDRDHTIGHGYFKDVTDLPSLRAVFRRKVIPLLQEYFFDDVERIAQVLGTTKSGSSFFAEKALDPATTFTWAPTADVERGRYEVTPDTEWDAEDFLMLYGGSA